MTRHSDEAGVGNMLTPAPHADAPLVEWAIWYATALGWPVFPLTARGKKPLTDHGYQDATIDPETITTWLSRWPVANIGTQHPSVLDCDLPRTPTPLTASISSRS